MCSGRVSEWGSIGGIAYSGALKFVDPGASGLAWSAPDQRAESGIVVWMVPEVPVTDADASRRSTPTPYPEQRTRRLRPTTMPTDAPRESDLSLAQIHLGLNRCRG